MRDPRAVDTTPLNPPDVEPEEKRRQLEGEELPFDQDAILDESEIDSAEPISDTEIYEGELEAGSKEPLDDGDASLELLTTAELRAGETDNPDVAAEEGESWVPPVDPPVVANAEEPGGVEIAAGFGTTAFDEPFDADHHSTALPDDDEMSERVREALRADSRTSRLADRLAVGTAGGIVAVRGVVDDIDDTDLIAEVVSEVPGVIEVRDETTLPDETG